MYYYSYEYEYGNGFFPFFSKNPLPQFTEIEIEFGLIVFQNVLVWIQKSGHLINGLDGYNGSILLNDLNAELNVYAEKILNKLDVVVYPKKEKTE